MESGPRKYGWDDHAARAAALLFVLAAGLIHLPYPFAGDQALITVAASAMSKGAVLYRDFWDYKPPGIYLFYILAGRLFGHGEIGVHLLDLLCMLLLSAALMGALSSRLLHPRIACIAPVLTVGFYYGLSRDWHLSQVEPLVGLPLFLCAWLATSAVSSPRPSGARLLASGLFGGAALAFKLVFLPIVGAFFASALTHAMLRTCGGRARLLARTCALWLAGMAAPLLCLVLHSARGGALDQAAYTLFIYPLTAVHEISADRTDVLKDGVEWFLLRFSPLLALGIAGGYTAIARRRDLLSMQIALWLILGLSVVLMQRLSWWQYHYLLLFCPAGVLATLGLDALWPALRGLLPERPSSRLALCALGLGLLAAPALCSLAWKGLVLMKHGLAIDREQRLRYQRHVSEGYASAHAETEFLSRPGSLPGDICAFGSPLILHLSGRGQAIPIHGWALQFLLRDQWPVLYRQLAEAAPPYVFLSDVYRGLIPERFAELGRFLSRRYDVLRAGPQGTWYIRRPESARLSGP